MVYTGKVGSIWSKSTSRSWSGGGSWSRSGSRRV